MTSIFIEETVNTILPIEVRNSIFVSPANTIILDDCTNVSFIAIAEQGIQGAPGVGVPAGGTAGQVLAKIDGSDFNTHWVNSGSGSQTPWAQNIDGGGFTLSNVSEIDAALFKGQYQNANGTAYINPNGSAVFANGAMVITNAGVVTGVSFNGLLATANISQFTNNSGYITNLSGFTTDNLTQGSTNKYFSNTLAIAALTGQNISIFSNNVGYITNLSSFTTDNLAQGSTNKYFSNALAVTALTGQNISIFTNNSGYITNLSSFTTDNLTQGSTNKYYSNAQVQTYLSTLEGAAFGLATLDATAKVPLSQIPSSLIGDVSYQGSWNANTNTPTLTSATGTKGFYYVVSVPGTTNLDGITDWQLGDWAIYNGTAWQKVDNTDAVISVNSAIGAVVLTVANTGSALAWSGVQLQIPTATNSLAGLLSAADHTTFAAKIGLTSLSGTNGVAYNNTTGVFSIDETFANVFTAQQTFNANNLLATIPTNKGIALTNTTATTTANRIQNSPPFYVNYNAWNSQTSTNNTISFGIYGTSTTPGFGAPIGTLQFIASIDGSGYADIFSVDTSGSIFVPGIIHALSQLLIGGPFTANSIGSFNGPVTFFSSAQFNGTFIAGSGEFTNNLTVLGEILDGSGNFIWNPAMETLGVGLGGATAAATIHAHSTFSQTAAAPSSIFATLQQVQGPVTGVNAFQDNSGSFYTANGSNYQIQIYQVDNSGNISPFGSFSFTDDNSGNPFEINYNTWNTASSGNGIQQYIIALNISSAGWNFRYTGNNNTNFIDNDGNYPNSGLPTPVQAGIQANGSNLNIGFDLYSLQIFGGVTVYNPADQSTSTADPGDSNYYTIQISGFSVPNYKILLTGGLTGAIVDSANPLTVDANTNISNPTTITPNAYIAPAGLFVRDTSSVSDISNLVLQSTNISTPTPSIDFQDSSGSSMAKLFAADSTFLRTNKGFQAQGGYLTSAGVAGGSITTGGLTFANGLYTGGTLSAVTTITNADGTLTISPTFGNAVASLNSAHNFTLSGNNIFSGNLTFSGAPVTGVAIGDSIIYADLSNSNLISKTTLTDLFNQYDAAYQPAGYSYFNHFINPVSATSQGGDSFLALGISGGTITAQATDDPSRVGIVRSSTGTGTTGRAGASSSVNCLRFGGGQWMFEKMLNITQLSAITNRFQVIIGFSAQITSSPTSTNGVFFLYDEGGVSTGSAASANWQCMTAKAGTRTQFTTSTAVAAATWVKLGINVNAAGTSVDFLINGVVVHTTTTNIPTAAGQEVGFGWLFDKSLGTTAVTMDSDWISVLGNR